MLDTSRKLVIVGDGMVGKTALLSAYVNTSFQNNYIPTVFETTVKEIHLPDGRMISLGLWDTGGQEEFDQVRQLAYPGASLILLCYAVDCPTSLDNVIHTWIMEVRTYCRDIPIILVGCKADRRSGGKSQGKHSALVHPDAAQLVSKQIGAHVNIECSAHTRSNVITVFELAARIILDMQVDQSKRTNLRRILSFNRDKSNTNGSVTSPAGQSSHHRKINARKGLLCFSKRS